MEANCLRNMRRASILSSNWRAFILLRNTHYAPLLQCNLHASMKEVVLLWFRNISSGSWKARQSNKCFLKEVPCPLFILSRACATTTGNSTMSGEENSKPYAYMLLSRSLFDVIPKVV